jgi:hypothetical protein
MLNVSIEDVQRLYIDEPPDIKIGQRYTGLTFEDVLDKAYDSLFKQLCATTQ